MLCVQSNVLDIGYGGGQLFRTALTLSALSGEPVHLKGIRRIRDRPGLRPQHLTALRLMRKISDAEVRGAHIGSQEVFFAPRRIRHGKFFFEVGTAGSVVLIFQTVLPALLMAPRPSLVRLSGGTHVPNAPSWEFFTEHFLDYLKNMFAVSVDTKLFRPGFYPAGGGLAEILVRPGVARLGILPTAQRAVIVLASLPEHIALREKKVFVQAELEPVYVRRYEGGVGNAVFCKRALAGAWVLGEKGVRAETVARQCLEQLDEGMDAHLADQVYLYHWLMDVPMPEHPDSEHLRRLRSLLEEFPSLKGAWKK